MSEITPAKTLRYFTDLIYLFLFMFLVCLGTIGYMEKKHLTQVEILREMMTESGKISTANTNGLAERMELLEDTVHRMDWKLEEMRASAGRSAP